MRRRRQGLSGWWDDFTQASEGFLDFFNPASTSLSKAALKPEEGSSPYEWTASYQETKQRLLAEEAARKAAEAKAAGKTGAPGGPPPGGGTSPVTVGIVLFGVYMLFFKK